METQPGCKTELTWKLCRFFSRVAAVDELKISEMFPTLAKPIPVLFGITIKLNIAL